MLSGLVQYGWIFGHSLRVHPDPAEQAWARAELDWWVPRTRRALEATGGMPRDQATRSTQPSLNLELLELALLIVAGNRAEHRVIAGLDRFRDVDRHRLARTGRGLPVALRDDGSRPLLALELVGLIDREALAETSEDEGVRLLAVVDVGDGLRVRGRGRINLPGESVRGIPGGKRDLLGRGRLVTARRVVVVPTGRDSAGNDQCGARPRSQPSCSWTLPFV